MAARKPIALPQASKSPLRLGYLVSQYPAVNHTFILREIRALRQTGFDIYVVSIRKPDRPIEKLSRDEAEEAGFTRHVLAASILSVAAIHLRTLISSPVRYWRALGYAIRLAGWDMRAILAHVMYFGEAVVAGYWFRRAKVRHVHTHFASTVMLIASRIFDLPFSVTIHGPTEFSDVAAFHLAEKVEAAGFVAVISRYAASQTMCASAPGHWHKIRVLPLGVDAAEFSAPPDRIPLSGATFRILCVGRLAPVKAHHILLAAIERLVSRGHTNLLLTIVGDGPSLASLEATVNRLGLAPYVRFTGACHHNRVLDFYRESDAFALASFAEGVPVVLMEAMAMEIPCVATWVAGIPELIRSGAEGLLVPPSDSDALADALLMLMDDPALCLRLGKAARARVTELYDISRNAAALGRILLECSGEVSMQVSSEATASQPDRKSDTLPALN